MRPPSKGIHPPDGGWESETFYIVQVAFSTRNTLHEALLYTGIIGRGGEMHDGRVWHPSYDSVHNASAVHYLSVVRRADVQFKVQATNARVAAPPSPSPVSAADGARRLRYVSTSPGNGPGNADHRIELADVDPRFQAFVAVTEAEYEALARLAEAHDRYHAQARILKRREREPRGR